MPKGEGAVLEVLAPVCFSGIGAYLFNRKVFHLCMKS